MLVKVESEYSTCSVSQRGLAESDSVLIGSMKKTLVSVSWRYSAATKGLTPRCVDLYVESDSSLC